MTAPYPPADWPMVVRSPHKGGAVRVNAEFSEQLGLNGIDLQEGALVEWIHPDDREDVEQALRAGCGRASARHRTRTGEWIPFDWMVRTHAGEPVVLGLYAFTGGANENSTSGRTSARRGAMSDLLDAMALIVEDKNPGLRCSILLLDETGGRIVGGAGPSLPKEYNEAIEGLHIGPTVGSCGTAAFWNTPVVVENIAEDPLWAELRDAAALAGVAACWSHPIVATDGSVLGAMALYDDSPRAPTRYEMDGLEVAARMVGLAIERDRLEGQLHRAAKMEALGVLAGGIAHDFNNMVTVVLGNAELAAQAPPESGSARAYLREIVNASLAVRELCATMLAYAGRRARTVEPLDCNDLVRDHATLLRVALSKKARLVFDLHPEPLGVLADAGQLRQVIMNLITNASDAIGDREGRIVVHTSSVHCSREDIASAYPDSGLEAGAYALLSVRDSGSGMTPETQARIFDPFFTTKAAGRGLGLAAVQGIVRGHGGAIALTTKPGTGTTFQVLLPAVPLPDRDAEPPPTARGEVPHARVLVVDDEASVRTLFTAILVKAGYDVVAACDGQEAVDTFRREGDSIDCVLLDLCMPRLDGEETFRELRKLRSDVRVVLVTGLAEQHAIDRLRSGGVAAVLQKPVELETLLTAVAETLTLGAH